jgi:hypothetical protein
MWRVGKDFRGSISVNVSLAADHQFQNQEKLLGQQSHANHHFSRYRGRDELKPIDFA